VRLHPDDLVVDRRNVEARQASNEDISAALRRRPAFKVRSESPRSICYIPGFTKFFAVRRSTEDVVESETHHLLPVGHALENLAQTITITFTIYLIVIRYDIFERAAGRGRRRQAQLCRERRHTF